MTQTLNPDGLRGKLIVFEGVEGCGKTTQLQRSLSWLQNLNISGTKPLSIVVTREPGGTNLGLGLRQMLLQANREKPIQDLAELLLYAADRAQHVKELLKPQLEKGAVVLCDRYTDSTIAYQGYGRGLDLNLIHQLNSIATEGLLSDLTLWLDIDVEVALARKQGSPDRIEQETKEFHQKVQQGYMQLALIHPERIVRVDASSSQAAVQEQIQKILSDWSHRSSATSRGSLL